MGVHIMNMFAIFCSPFHSSCSVKSSIWLLASMPAHKNEI